MLFFAGGNEEYLSNNENSFFLIYIDTVSDINSKDLYEFYKIQKSL